MDVPPQTAKSIKAVEQIPIYLVCSTMHGPNAAETVCSKCGSVIWPTKGSLARARLQPMTTICTDCYGKIGEIVFGGVMDNGRMVPEQIAEKVLLAFEQSLLEEQIERRRKAWSGV